MKYEFLSQKGSRRVVLTDATIQRLGSDDPYRLANTLRKALGRKALAVGQGQDGKDVAGVGQVSPFQLIWTGKSFTPLPYDAEKARPGAVRSGTGKSKKKFFIDLRSAMDNYKVVIGKRVKGAEVQFEARPIANYNKLVEALLEGKINKHSADQLRFGKTRKLTINTAGVDIPEQAIEELTVYGEMLEVQIDWVRLVAEEAQAATAKV